ncbi:methyltransferase [Salinactinospora qingdaonensis]|uniref:Methyltransferase n=1 Tax=Salinactinospora qingdaonensis TaxID=702744 RepID=A0ABP7F9S6_9ACTN
MTSAKRQWPPSPDLDAPARLTELADYIVPFTLRAVCDLGIADLLTDGPRTVDDLAEQVGAHAPSLHRALRVLASKGIFTETHPGTFDLSPLAEPLRSDHPLSLRDAYPLLTSDVDAWARFDHCIRTGEAAFDLVHGQGYWDYMADNPEQSRRVDRSMASINRLHLRTVLPAYDWGSFDTVIDVGGGNGAFLAGILAKFRSLHGTVYDLPHVVAAATDVFAAAGVSDRATSIGGSFFDHVPPGADGYLLKTVLPGFTDDEAVRALRRVRAAMRPDSRLLLLEAIIPDGDDYDAAKLVDLHTLMLTGGSHRSQEGLATLLGRAGLDLVLVRPTASLTVVEAVSRPSEGVGTPTTIQHTGQPAEFD